MDPKRDHGKVRLLRKKLFLEFDFSDQKDQTAFSRLLLQFNGENNNDQVTAYVDNLFIHR